MNMIHLRTYKRTDLFCVLDEKEERELLFRPFQKLTGANDPILLVSQIQLLIEAEEFTRAEEKSKELMSLCLQGLRYFQTYDWLFLRSIVTAGYVGWCIFCLLFVIRNYVLPSYHQYQIPFKSRTTVCINRFFLWVIYKIKLKQYYFRLTSCH